jgi:hypothetical protein
MDKFINAILCQTPEHCLRKVGGVRGPRHSLVRT